MKGRRKGDKREEAGRQKWREKTKKKSRYKGDRKEDNTQTRGRPTVLRRQRDRTRSWAIRRAVPPRVRHASRTTGAQATKPTRNPANKPTSQQANNPADRSASMTRSQPVTSQSHQRKQQVSVPDFHQTTSLQATCPLVSTTMRGVSSIFQWKAVFCLLGYFSKETERKLNKQKTDTRKQPQKTKLREKFNAELNQFPSYVSF